MPDLKNPLLRYHTIDRELCKSPSRRVKTSQICKILLEEFDIKVTTRQIQKDIEAMQSDSRLSYYAPIEKDKKKKAYYYTDSKYTIKKFGLREEEIQSLGIMLRILKQYSQFGMLRDVTTAIEKIESGLQLESGIETSNRDVWQRVVMEPLAAVNNPMNRFLPKFVQAIDQQKKVRFEYRKFGDADSKWRRCIPAWLKEYKGLWYLIADEEESGKRKTFALDRMSQVEVLEEHGHAENVNLETHYRHCMGITSHNQPPEKILLSFTPKTGYYVKVIPLHSTQKLVNESDEELQVEIEVIPSYELYAALLSYGEDLTVISPSHIRIKLKKMLKSAYNNYS